MRNHPKRNLKIILLLTLGFILMQGIELHAQILMGRSERLLEIIIIGNKHTNKAVILRELLFKKGDMVNDSLLNASKKRLENLWLFNRIEFFAMPGKNQKTFSLLISVTERLFIFPYPIFTVNDRDWNKLTYGFGLAHTNFRGWNEQLFAQILFGNRPGYGFSFSDPWINRNLHFMAGVYLQKYLSANHAMDFDEHHLTVSFSFGKYWNRYFYSKVSLFRDAVSVEQTFAPFMETRTTKDVNYGYVLTTVYDRRDLYAYPTKGFYVRFIFRKSGLFVPEIHFTQYGFDLRKYFNWHKLILASHLYTLQSLGRLPVYNRVYFGFSHRIRGHFFEVIEGRHSFISGLALRFPLIAKHYYSMPSPLLPESSTKNLYFGLNGGFFAESGIVYEKRREFAVKNFISGFGMGLHFLLPYIELLRVDLAFNEHLKHQFIIEIQMPF